MTLKELGLSELEEILTSGEFSKFIGKIENEFIEFKQKAYSLGKPSVNSEFAKDISAFANVEGGYIIIGLITEKDPNHLVDRVTKLNLVKRDSIDIEQYHKIITEWVYPSPSGILINWHTSDFDGEKGIITIKIPKQPETNKPFIITKTIFDDGKRRDILFGYSQRKRANAQPIGVHQLQSLIRDGLNYQN